MHAVAKAQDRRRSFAVAAAVVVAYALGVVCAWLLDRGSPIAVFYPPVGVTVAALLLTARHRWPWVLAAAGLTELIAGLLERTAGLAGLAAGPLHGQDPPVAAGLVLARLAEPLLAAVLLRRLVPAGIDLSRRRDAAAFVGCCVVAAPLAGAVLAATVVAAGPGGDWWEAFGPYWAGDGLAVLTAGAAGVGLGAGVRPGSWRAVARAAALKAAGTAPLLALTAGLTVAAFWQRNVPLAYLPLPVLVAVAFRGRVARVAAAGFVMAFAANLMTGAGNGPWSALADRPRLEAASLQAYLAVAVLTAGVLAIGIAERDRARREVAANRRLRALQDVTAGLATAATSTQIGTVLVERAAGLVADRVALALLDGDATHWRLFTAGPDAATGTGIAALPVSESADRPVTAAAATGRTVLAATPEDLVARFPRAVTDRDGAGIRSVFAVPVRVGGRSDGALAFGFAAEGGGDAEAASVARTLAELAGQALERAELYEAEYQAAHQLQQALLPRVAADLPGVRAGVSYHPAQTGHAVGGDWYDVFELPGNRVGFTVGDVIGHDLRAASVMGQLQTLLRSVALTGAPPAEVLEALDQACARVDGAECATVGYGEYSPSERIIRYACAGHPPPLLVAGGEARYLLDGRSQPLGLAIAPRPEGEAAVPDEAALVWYSDGLVERRGQSYEVGLDRLVTVARSLTGDDAQAWSDTVLAEMTAGQVIEDDVVVACLHLHGHLAAGSGRTALRQTLRDTSELSATRRRLRDWAEDQHMSDAQRDALLLVCTEALSNALEHARGTGNGAVVELNVVRADHEQVRVEVSDHGRWRPNIRDDEEHGRGLVVISRLARRATLDLRRDGTRVTVNLPVQ